MYGTWFNLTAGLAVGIVALVIGLVIAASPLLAVVIALFLGGLAAFGAALRRSGEYVEGSEGERRRSSREVGPKPSGAPASGEGDSAGTLPPNPGAPTREAGA
jgi:hypothetical protein